VLLPLTPQLLHLALWRTSWAVVGLSITTLHVLLLYV